METTKDFLVGETEELLFCKMLDMGVDPVMAKKIMSFWMFLESKGFKDIYKNIIHKEVSFLRCACAEAEAAFAFLECKSNKRSISCPFTWTLAPPGLIPTEVLGDKENVSNDISAIQNDVYKVAFEDILDERGIKAKVEDPNVKEAIDEGSSGVIPASKSNLNPNAEEWKPVPKDERSLFMTFSRGHPLFTHEIVRHFQRKYGDCVENIFIHNPQDREPEFGKLIFKCSWIVNLILHQNEIVKIYIGGKTLCLKKYNKYN